MIVRPHPSNTSMMLWFAEGANEQELKEGLGLGYIEWRGVRLDIDKVQDYPVPSSLVTKMVTVKPPTENQLRILNDLMINFG